MRIEWSPMARASARRYLSDQVAMRAPGPVYRGRGDTAPERITPQDSVSASSDTAVRGSSIDRTAQSVNAPMAYGAV